MGIGDEVNVEYTEEDILTQPVTSDYDIDVVKQKVKRYPHDLHPWSFASDAVNERNTE